MPNHLKVTEIEAVGFVDKGANPGSRVVFWKRHNTEDGNQMSDKQKNNDRGFDLEALPEEAKDYIATLEEGVEKSEEIGGLKAWLKETFGERKAEEKPPEDDATGEEEGTDDLNPAVAKRFETIEKQAADFKKQAEAAEERVRKMEDEARLTEIRKIAETECSKIGDAETAKLLKSIDEKVDRETFEKLQTLLRTANERVKASLFEEFGKAGSSDGKTAHDEAGQLARDMVEKSGDLTFEKAYVRVLEENRDLAARVNSEAN